MPDFKLYNYPRSGNCYKVRLLLSILDLPCELIDIDLLEGESFTDEFKRINPRGQVPVLQDGEQTIWDSMAILVYLAKHRDRIVSRQELLEELWTGRVVTESTLSSRVKAARHAVGDSNGCRALYNRRQRCPLPGPGPGDGGSRGNG